MAVLNTLNVDSSRSGNGFKFRLSIAAKRIPSLDFSCDPDEVIYDKQDELAAVKYMYL